MQYRIDPLDPIGAASTEQPIDYSFLNVSLWEHDGAVRICIQGTVVAEFKPGVGLVVWDHEDNEGNSVDAKCVLPENETNFAMEED